MLLTHFVNVFIEVVIEILTRFLRIEIRVNGGHRENRSGIVERIPNRSIVGVPVFFVFIDASRLPQTNALTCSFHVEVPRMVRPDR